MEGQSIVSDKLKFLEIRTKFKATNDVNPEGLKLVSSANEHGLLFIGCQDKTIKAVSTDQILISRKTTTPGQFVFTLQLTFVPTLLSVARQGFSSILLVAGHNSLELFDIDDRSSIGKVELNEELGTRIIDYAWHPTYYESILTLCTNKGWLLVVGFNRKEKLAALVCKDQQYHALTCCWSPKGKHLAIGMSNGKITRLEPTIEANSFSFKEVKNSTITFESHKITSEHQVIKLRWLIKTSLICVHARPNATAPDTVYSITTVKPGKPYKYWTNLCFERGDSHYNVDVINLISSVICSSNSSSEVAVLGVSSNDEATVNEPANWNSVVIDEEGGRIELPLDSNNCETSSRGMTLVSSSSSGNSDRYILVFYTSDGFLCPYTAVHSDNLLKLPELQQLQKCPLNIPKPIIEPKKPEIRPSAIIEEPVIELDLSSAAPALKQIGEGIDAIKRGIETNARSLSLLDEINHLRATFDEIQDIHKTHREVLNAIEADIDSLRLGWLEDRYLIERINSPHKGASSKSSWTLEKVENIKRKSKEISEKLRDLNSHVDVSWEDYVRQRNALENRDRRLNSLDIIYKTLANNQKIINFLKKKSANLNGLPPTPKLAQVDCDTARLELDPAKMRALREFLASRTTVPIRKPYTVKTVSRRPKLQ